MSLAKLAIRTISLDANDTAIGGVSSIFSSKKRGLRETIFSSPGNKWQIPSTNFAEKGIKITKIVGADLPLETQKNVAGVAVLAIIESLDLDFGFEIEIYKNIKAGSGIGSSSASAAGAVFGINELLGKPFSKVDTKYFVDLIGCFLPMTILL